MTTAVEEIGEPEDDGDTAKPKDELSVRGEAESNLRRTLTAISQVIFSHVSQEEALDPAVARAKRVFLTEAFKAMTSICESVRESYSPDDDDEPFTIDTSRFGKDM